ncbi:HAMP domain-containing sensor histidine kinase [Breoghania sp.]|uniref:sensor histidine kinase n=1 Tax=Breoghania sp. TaxID=2065378 RepID=UPI002AA95B00|nr:HAMP domain-containing sensor histidine kinase [Breoghania sp.]
MTTLGKLVRTTAFKLSLVYLVAFALFAGFLVFYIGHNTQRMMAQQINETIEAEVKGLGEQYSQGGIRRLVDVVDRRARQPGASLYLITDFSGDVIAGNVKNLKGRMPRDPDVPIQVVRYERNAGDGEPQEAAVRVFVLPGGFHILIGRDISEGERFREVIESALRITIAVVGVLAVLSWLFVGRRVLSRIDAVSDTGRRIMEGDLSRRLHVTGSGDEIDRLAENVNAMLERIELLMQGLKDVSDNIAHDLKTPLTRLRNRVEGALREEPSVEGYREALEATIEESDQLIRTFNALLKIARVEAGSPDQVLERVDASEIAAEVAELYEPLAEDEGVKFMSEICDTVPVEASRELIAQAISNLVDNALKYGRPQPKEGEKGPQFAITLRVFCEGGDVVLSVADNGPGISLSDHERVLRRFVRLEESRTAPGSGLGLSLVQAVANLHRGKLELADNDPGLIARLRLPKAQ